MTIINLLDEHLKDAIKKRDKTRMSTIRGLKAHLKNEEIAKGQRLSEPDELTVIIREMKQRKEAIEQFKKGNRADLVNNETKELEIILSYLPEQIDDAEIRVVLREIIEKTGATSTQDMGRVMGAAMKELKGKADGKVVRQIVEEMLKS